MVKLTIETSGKTEVKEGDIFIGLIASREEKKLRGGMCFAGDADGAEIIQLLASEVSSVLDTMSNEGKIRAVALDMFQKELKKRIQ